MQKSKQNKCFHPPLTNMKQMKTKAIEPTQKAVEKPKQFRKTQSHHTQGKATFT